MFFTAAGGVMSLFANAVRSRGNDHSYLSKWLYLERFGLRGDDYDSDVISLFTRDDGLYLSQWWNFIRDDMHGSGNGRGG